MRMPTIERRRPSNRRILLIALVAVVVVLLVSLRGIAGFYTDYLWFKELGYTDVSASKLANLAILGVTPAYVRELRAAGLTNLTPHEAEELRIGGITTAKIDMKILLFRMFVCLQNSGALNQESQTVRQKSLENGSLIRQQKRPPRHDYRWCDDRVGLRFSG